MLEAADDDMLDAGISAVASSDVSGCNLINDGRRRRALNPDGSSVAGVADLRAVVSRHSMQRPSVADSLTSRHSIPTRSSPHLTVVQ